MTESQWALVIQTLVVLGGLGVAWNRIAVKLSKVCERLDSHSKAARVTRDNLKEAHDECRADRIQKEREHSKVIHDTVARVAAIEARGEGG